MVFEIQAFLCYAFLKKILNRCHFWQVKYLLKLGKTSLHRYPVGQKFCRNPTSKFLFYEDNGFKKYSYISIVLYVYLMSLYFQFLCFAFFVKNSKIEYDPHFWGGKHFWKLEASSLFRQNRSISHG